MAVRALIIAVEHYPSARDLAPALPGTSDAGEAFYTWLVEAKGVAPRDIRCCTAEGRRGRTAGTTRAEVLSEVAALAREGRDRTAELYVFFSGHGLTSEEGQGLRPVDVLLTSDHRSAAEPAGIGLRELSQKLQRALGPGEHVYFIDARRNVVGPDAVAPLGIGGALGTSSWRIDGLHMLYDTAPGPRAEARSPFANALLAGLRGAGTAKGWEGDRMAVRFSRLAGHVREKVPGGAAGRLVLGPGDVKIWDVPPPYSVRCTVRTPGLPSCVIVVRDLRGQPQARFDVDGGVGSIDLPPGDYVLTPDDRPGGTAVTLYEAKEVVIEQPSPDAGITLDEALSNLPDPRPARSLAAIRAIEDAIGSGEAQSGDLTADLSRALASLGASLITAAEGAPARSGVLVLAVLSEGGDVAIEAAGLARDARRLDPLAGIAGVIHASFEAGPGPLLVTLAPSRPGLPSHSFVSHVLDGWITVVTIVNDLDGAAHDIVLRQFFVPTTATLAGAPRRVRQAWSPEGRAATVSHACHALDAFARRRPVGAVTGAPIDPMGSLLRLYDRRRRGNEVGAELAELAASYPSLPDLAALAGSPALASPPIVIDGLLAIGDDAAALPLPASRLTYEEPWTMWRAQPAPRPGRDERHGSDAA